MKEEELRTHAKCSVCGKGIGHTGLPFFWTLTVDRYGLVLGALRRNGAIADYFGGGHTGSVLARALGEDEDMAEKIMDTVTLTLCENCAMERLTIPALCEAEAEKSQGKRRCRVCGCTDDDCHQCIEKTGKPCYWVEEDLCSACAEEKL
jgi:hypothetical protein